MLYLILSLVFALLAITLPRIVVHLLNKPATPSRRRSRFDSPEENVAGEPSAPSPNRSGTRILTRAACIMASLACFTMISLINVPDETTMHLVSKLGRDLPEGRYVALDGEAGPQADVLTPGWKFRFMVRLVNELKPEPVFEVPDGKCAILVARDGVQMSDDKSFADAFDPEEASKMVGDANYFLTNGGVRGPQTSVLRPGMYHFNHYLWGTPELVDATVVPEGNVGVVKSAVHSRVDLPNFTAEKPPVNAPKITRTIELPGNEKPIQAEVVRVGSIGIWEKALPNATYYLNPNALKVTMVPIRATTWEYKGGYTRREIDLTVSEDGKIQQTPKEEKIPVPTGADPAVDLYVEGWPIFQELRVVAQITALDAPFVVAAVGDNLSAVEDIIMTPIIRDVVRDVLGGGTITANDIGADGQPSQVTRRIQILDLFTNRTPIMKVIEEKIKPEGTKAFTTIHDVRLAYAEIPPEVTLPRRMKQLSEQLVSSYEQQKLAQEQRIEAEKQRALADKQGDLQAAQIEVQRSELLMQAEENKGVGEQKKLEAIAKGQKAQMDVLGEDRVVELRKYELMLQFYTDNSELLGNMLRYADRFVPVTSINMGDGSSGGLNGPAAIFGTLMNGLSSPGSMMPKNNTPATDSGK